MKFGVEIYDSQFTMGLQVKQEAMVRWCTLHVGRGVFYIENCKVDAAIQSNTSKRGHKNVWKKFSCGDDKGI